MLNLIKKIQRKEKGGQPECRGHGNGRDPENLPKGQEPHAKPEVSRKILVVGRGERMDAAVMDYAVNLAARLGYDLISLSVNPAPGPEGRIFSPYRRHLRMKITQRAKAVGEDLKQKWARKGVCFEQVVKFGNPGKAVAEVNRQIKRIEFVITQAGIKEEEVAGELSLPVFSITGHQGERRMAKESDRRGSKPIGKTAGYGLAAAALYAGVFWHSDTVMRYFTKGAWYAALPIATVFIFSLVHGAFAHHLWEALGIQAAKRVQPRPAAAQRPVARRRPRPQLRIDT